MLVVGFYIQSSITAIRLVPMDLPVVGSYQDLFHFIKTGRLTPCYNADWDVYFGSPKTVEDREFRKVIAFAGMLSPYLIYHGGGFSECYRRTQARTHVALSVCTDEETEAASNWNLEPGDHLLTTIRAPAIHVTNPHR
ncbi:hypothetical protein HPB50_023195 [Hyalomma asiaticum]|uniref:Uncharacterized protein n=1 Tax=Hyalomma asiaticum TaxID=266040 RepID=A0ACB7RWL3_HYAAI|nr:hypothetical protein HPB50_023195 [Hyalomma asiaticum]